MHAERASIAGFHRLVAMMACQPAQHVEVGHAADRNDGGKMYRQIASKQLAPAAAERHFETAPPPGGPVDGWPG